MRTLSLDDLDHVGGGLALGLLPQLNQNSQFVNPLPQQGLGLIPQGYPIVGYDPGFAQGLGQIGQIVNQLVHTPAVAGLIGQFVQQVPQLAPVIQGALGAIGSGNIGALAQQFLGGQPGIGQFGPSPFGVSPYGVSPYGVGSPLGFGSPLGTPFFKP